MVVMVMRVFVDAFPHIPEHRRLPLFSQLMSTVGAERYLARMLALLIGGYVTKGAAAMHPGDEIDVKVMPPGLKCQLCDVKPPKLKKTKKRKEKLACRLID